MSSYKERSQTKTYLTSRTGLSESAIKLSEHHDYKLGKHSFGIQNTSLDQGFEIIGKIVADVDEIRLKTQQIESTLYVDIVARCFQNRWSNLLDSFRLPDENLNGAYFKKNFRIIVKPKLIKDQLDLNDGYFISLEDFAKRMDIVLIVRLEDKNNVDDTLIANRPYQVLEKKKFRITKESSGKGFNTKFESFTKLGYPQNALWYIEFQNFEDPPEDAVSIFLNKDIEKLKILLDDSSKRNERLKVGRDILLRSIIFDVFYHLSSKFIQQEGGEIEEWKNSEDRSSLGAILANQLDELFEKRSVNDIVRDFKDKPERFRSELQVVCNFSNSLKGV